MLILTSYRSISALVLMIVRLPSRLYRLTISTTKLAPSPYNDVFSPPLKPHGPHPKSDKATDGRLEPADHQNIPSPESRCP
ncbi:MAG: hypothetical protein VXY77_00785 [Pseudomonadota bacterium]|nr:hypothetical protein [Pseudomonadota bacterium]